MESYGKDEAGFPTERHSTWTVTNPILNPVNNPTENPTNEGEERLSRERSFRHAPAPPLPLGDPQARQWVVQVKNVC